MRDLFVGKVWLVPKKLGPLFRDPLRFSGVIWWGAFRHIRFRSWSADATAYFPKESSNTSKYPHSESEQDITDESDDNVNDKRLRDSAPAFPGAPSNNTCIPA